MPEYLLSGPGAVALGALAGGCLSAWVTPEAAASQYADDLAVRFPALGGRCRTMGMDPELRDDGLPAGDGRAGARAGVGPDPAGPLLWLCTGAELPGLLRLLAPVAAAPAAPGPRAAPAAPGPRTTAPAAPGPRTAATAPAAPALVVSLPPSPGLEAALADLAPAWVWCPGSSRMAYRLAAAGCRAAAAGRGPAVLLLDGELPPETVHIPEAQVPGQAAPTVRTRTPDDAPPLAAGRGHTPVPGRSDLLAAVAAAPRPEELPPLHYQGPGEPDLLLVGTGTAFGELARARTELQGAGHAAGHLHLRQLRPFPPEAGPVWAAARQRLVAEPPGGGLAALLAGALGLPAAPEAVPNLDLLAGALRNIRLPR